MVHRCVIKSVLMWLHILLVSLLMYVCCTVRECTDNALPEDGVTAPKHVGAILM